MTNKSKLDEQLAILQAAKEGKQIEVGLVSGWFPVADPKDIDYDFRNYEYRIKKEPDVLYQVECRYVSSNEWSVYARRVSKEEAERWEARARVIYPYTRIRKFAEVLDDEG